MQNKKKDGLLNITFSLESTLAEKNGHFWGERQVSRRNLTGERQLLKSICLLKIIN
jgi:hypothetical protein